MPTADLHGVTPVPLVVRGILFWYTGVPRSVWRDLCLRRTSARASTQEGIPESKQFLGGASCRLR